MIANETYNVTSPSGDILLGPCDVSHFRATLPVPGSLLTHILDDARAFYENADPNHLMRDLQSTPHSQIFGIFTSTRRTPDAFAGTISINDEFTTGANGEDASTPLVKEIGCELYRPELQGKGLGVLSVLALAQVAHRNGVKALHADTSIHNIPAQRSLAKSGFAHLFTDERPDIVIGGQPATFQQWWLLDREHSGSFGNAKQPQLEKGRAIYEAAIKSVHVEQIA